MRGAPGSEKPLSTRYGGDTELKAINLANLILTHADGERKME